MSGARGRALPCGADKGRFSMREVGGRPRPAPLGPPGVAQAGQSLALRLQTNIPLMTGKVGWAQTQLQLKVRCAPKVSANPNQKRGESPTLLLPGQAPSKGAGLTQFQNNPEKRDSDGEGNQMIGRNDWNTWHIQPGEKKI